MQGEMVVGVKPANIETYPGSGRFPKPGYFLHCTLHVARAWNLLRQEGAFQSSGDPSKSGQSIEGFGERYGLLGATPEAAIKPK